MDGHRVSCCHDADAAADAPTAAAASSSSPRLSLPDSSLPASSLLLRRETQDRTEHKRCSKTRGKDERRRREKGQKKRLNFACSSCKRARVSGFAFVSPSASLLRWRPLLSSSSLLPSLPPFFSRQLFSLSMHPTTRGRGRMRRRRRGWRDNQLVEQKKSVIISLTSRGLKRATAREREILCRFSLSSPAVGRESKSRRMQGRGEERERGTLAAENCICCVAASLPLLQSRCETRGAGG